MKRLRNYFISGLLFWIPLALTVLVIKFFLEVVNNLVPPRLLPESLLNLDTTIPGSGIILVILIILILRVSNILLQDQGGRNKEVSKFMLKILTT